MNNQHHAAKVHRGLAAVSGVIITSLVAFAVLMPQLSASASQEEYLMADYMQWNIVTFGDAHLKAESEGAVAVGGALSFDSSNTATQHSSSDDAEGIGLLAHRIDLAKSSGMLQVIQGAIRIEDDTQVDVLNRDGNNAQIFTHVVSKNAGVNSSPSVVANNSRQGADTVVVSGLFASLFSQNTAQVLAQQIAAYPQSDTQGAQAVVSIEGGKAKISLSEGKTNYWPLSSQALASLHEITFENAVPDANTGTFLIVPISGSEVIFNLNLAGSRDSSAILWVTPDAGSVTQSGDSLDGSLLAPKANLTKESANIQGTVVVASGSFAGSEQHHYPYKGKVPAVVPTEDPTNPVTPVITTTSATPMDTSADPTTSEPTTTDPTTSDPTSSSTSTDSSTVPVESDDPDDSQTPISSTTSGATKDTATDKDSVSAAAGDVTKTAALAKTGGGGAIVGAAGIFVIFAAGGTLGIAMRRSSGRNKHR